MLSRDVIEGAAQAFADLDEETREKLRGLGAALREAAASQGPAYAIERLNRATQRYEAIGGASDRASARAHLSDPDIRISPVRSDAELLEESIVSVAAWDRATARGLAVNWPRPFGPSRIGSVHCESGSIASGGRNEYCTCPRCW